MIDLWIVEIKNSNGTKLRFVYETREEALKDSSLGAEIIYVPAEEQIYLGTIKRVLVK